MGLGLSTCFGLGRRVLEWAVLLCTCVLDQIRFEPNLEYGRLRIKCRKLEIGRTKPKPNSIRLRIQYSVFRIRIQYSVCCPKIRIRSGQMQKRCGSVRDISFPFSSLDLSRLHIFCLYISIRGQSISPKILFPFLFTSRQCLRCLLLPFSWLLTCSVFILWWSLELLSIIIIHLDTAYTLFFSFW